MPQKINMFLTTNKATTSTTLSTKSMLRNTNSSTLNLGNLKQIYMNKNVSCG